MSTVYLVSCVKKKSATPVAAQYLYQSDWFGKARSYVISQVKAGDRWYILSAKYHLVEPTKVLVPYNETLNAMPVRGRRDWAHQVLADLQSVLKPEDSVVMLAGERYREFLERDLVDCGYKVDIPMRGLAIGKQLGWLKAELAKAGITE